MNLLPKKKVVPELTSFKDFYNHNILSITLPYIKKKTLNITPVKVFSIPSIPLRATEHHPESVCS